MLVTYAKHAGNIGFYCSAVLTVMVDGTNLSTHEKTHGCLHLIDLAGEVAAVGYESDLNLCLGCLFKIRLFL